MGAFSVFIVAWCFAAFLFPVASISSVIKHSSEEETAGEIVISGDQTIFLDDFNGKELFRLPGNYSEQQILEHGGKTFLLYFDCVEDKQIFMKVKEVGSNSFYESEPGLENLKSPD